MDIALEITGLKKKYGSRVALDGLEMKIPTGSVLGLVGPNGSGKTTTFSIIGGLLAKDSGTVNILEEGEFSSDKFKGRFSLLPQDSLFPPYSKVLEILTFFARLQGENSKDAEKAAKKVLEELDLADRANSKIRTLSHGMIRRLSVAQAFLGNPELIILDEPTGGLDPKQVVRVRQLIQKRNKNQTVIISSHILSEIEEVCDSVAFIEKGRNVYQESIKTALRKENVIHYILGANELNVKELELLITKADFQLFDDNSKLTVSFSENSLNVAEINRKILHYLLEKKIDIMELHTGTDLEDEYLKFSSV